MTTKKLFSCLFVKKNTPFGSFPSCLREAIRVYKTGYYRVSMMVSCIGMYVVAHGLLDVVGMFILSIVTCTILSTGNLFFKQDFNLDHDQKKKIVSSRFGVLFFCTIFQFLILAAYCPTPFTRHSVGEALLWATVTSTAILLQDVVHLFYQAVPTQSKTARLLKILTTRFMGNYMPLGSLLIYILYLPYACAYGVLFFLSEQVSDTTLMGIVFLIFLLIILVQYLYYRLATYLIQQVHARTD